MNRAFRNFIAAVAVWTFAAVSVHAFQTSGRALIVLDHGSGLVLAEKNADMPLPPASMSKIMTIYMVFEALEDGRLSLTHKLPVSAEAAQYGGSTMFLSPGERVSVEDLIRGVIVLSGNDASAVLAEALSPDGTESGFARLMTERAREIGLSDSQFKNSNGWPDPDQVMSARDLARLSSLLITEFPEHYRYFAEREFNFDNRAPENRRNRNPLLRLDFGADGLKTGYTSEAGYGLVGSVVRGSRRVVFVVAGLESRSIRQSEGERIVNWYFFQFRERELYQPGEPVIGVPVWMGNPARLNATVAERTGVLVGASASGEITARAVFDGAIVAPIRKGQEIGRLEVETPGFSQTVVFPLVASADVERGGFGARIRAAVNSLAGRVGLFEPLSR